MHRRWFAAIPPMVVLALLAAACGSTTGTTAGSTVGSAPSRSDPGPSPATTVAPPPSGYHPVIDPAGFSAMVDNPWFPLEPGMTWIYRGTKDGEPARDVYTVTSATRVIDGVPCVVVDDRLYLSGHLAERTTDYYTQDWTGNVWYFGEDTAELDEHGKVTSTEGTWHAGVDGAEPGIFMEADPTVGVTFRQEYYAGHAEDQFRVVDLSSAVTVPYRSYQDALRTEEWTTLEPAVLDNKYYVREVGEVAEVSVKGPKELLRLVSFTTA